MTPPSACGPVQRGWRRFASRRPRRRSPLVVLLAGGILLLAAAPSLAEQADSLRVHFLDVGQGDATLLEVPGGRWVLIDAGRDARVVEKMRRLGVDTLDLFVASHNHADHIGGAPDVIESFPVRYFMDNGVEHTTVTYRRMLEALLARDVPLLEPERRAIELGRTRLEILPPPGDPTLGHNDNSVGVVVHHGDFRATFAGDAEECLWAYWLGSVQEELRSVQLHKASHHGSRNGDVREAVERLGPELVVVSAGRGNPYGHPHPEALELYAGVGAAVLITAEVGTVRVTAAPDGSFRVSERGSPAPRRRSSRRLRQALRPFPGSDSRSDRSPYG